MVELERCPGCGAGAPFLAPGALAGPVDEVPDRIAEYVDAGAHEVNIALRAPWDDAMLDAYLELLPAIRAASG